jgi:hypothetical protein
MRSLLAADESANALHEESENLIDQQGVTQP